MDISPATLRLSVLPMETGEAENVGIDEIDEALKYAVESKMATDDSRKHIIDDFINDLLDERLEANK
jgi:hypothetical protein